MIPSFYSHTVLAVFGIAAVGGIIGLDRTAVGQFMVSQPIVAGPFAGWLLGDLTAGSVIGAALELIWLLDMPIGTFVPADATVGTMSATAIAALGSSSGASLPVIGFSILLTTVMVPITMRADGVIRKWNSRFADVAQGASAADMGQAVARAQVIGVALFFLKSFILYCIFIPFGIEALKFFGYLPVPFTQAMALFVKLLPMLGVALVARKLSVRLFDRFLMSGFVCAVFFGIFMHFPALVVLLIAVIAGWLGALYYERKP